MDISYWILGSGFFQSFRCIAKRSIYICRLFFLRKGIIISDNPDFDLSGSKPYKIYLLCLAFIPIPMLWIQFDLVQTIYAMLGAVFLPMLAITLLIMNNKKQWIAKSFRNGPFTNSLLILTLMFFLYFVYLRYLN